jgi:hypothetical protein
VAPIKNILVDHSGGIQSLACWECGFESRLEQEYFSVTSVVCCEVEFSTARQSLVQTSPIECGVSECDPET